MVRRSRDLVLENGADLLVVREYEKEGVRISTHLLVLGNRDQSPLLDFLAALARRKNLICRLIGSDRA